TQGRARVGADGRALRAHRTQRVGCGNPGRPGRRSIGSRDARLTARRAAPLPEVPARRKRAQQPTHQPKWRRSMRHIVNLSDDEHKKLERDVQLAGRGKATLEAAARAYTSLMYEELEGSIVLTRLFATVPRRALTPSRARFASSLAESAGVSGSFDDST